MDLQHLSISNVSLFLFSFFISVSNSISSMIIIFFLISFVFSKRKYENIKRITKKSINQSVFIFFLFASLSYLWCENNFFFNSINKYSILLIVPLLDLLNYKKAEKTIAVFFFISGIIFNIIYSFFISALYQLTILNKLFLLKNDHYQNEFFFRGFIDHSNLSILVSFTIFILLSYLFNTQKRKKKIKKNSLRILIFILVLFLLNSYGRTGLFTLIMLLPIFFLIKNPKNVKLLMGSSLVILFLSISISTPFKNRIQTTFNFQKDTRTEDEKIEEDAQYMVDSLGKDINYWKTKINEDLDWKNKIINKTQPNSMGNRYEIWEDYKIQILETLVLGKGVGAVQKIVNEENNTAPHNSYILIIFEIGMIGLILFLNIFYIQIKKFFTEKRKTILKLIFPLFFLICMIINDYIIIYNTACFFSLFSFLLYSEERKTSN